MSDEKSNVEKLGEDLKGVANDVANSNAVKAVRDKMAEVAESDIAQKAKKRIAEVTNSETAQKAKEKVTDAAKSAKGKLDELAEDERVKQAKTKLSEEFSNIKGWVAENWTAGGYGRVRVAVMAVVVLLAIRGLLCGWSDPDSRVVTSGESASASQSDLEVLFTSEPETHLYACRYCGNQIRSKSWPNAFLCPQRPQHQGKMRLPNLPCQWQKMD